MAKPQSMPWPSSRNAINPAFIDAIAQKLAAATPASPTTNKTAILSIINDEIEAYYKNSGIK